MGQLHHRAVGVLAGCITLLAGGAACMQEDCSQAACGSGPSTSLLLTTSNAGEVIPLPLSGAVGVYLPGHVAIVSSNDEVLAPISAAVQTSNATFRGFQPVRQARPRDPWSFGGRVTVRSPGDDEHTEWHVTMIVGTDPSTKTDGYATYSSSFDRTENKLAIGQSFVLSWPLDFSPPSSSNGAVLWPATGVITVAEGGLSLKGQPHTGPAYQEQLFAAVAPGSAVLTMPRHGAGKDCGTNDTGNMCLKMPGFTVVHEATWSCSVDGGCVQVHWDGVSRIRPEL